MIYTIGHSTRELGEFLDLLAAHRVTQVVDVRRYPASRRHPHFARDALAAALEAVGVAYHHEPELGGRRTARRDSTNAAWRSASFRGYADYMETSGFEEALTRLRELARARPTAVLCEIGRASCRERVKRSVVAVSFNNTTGVELTLL